MTSQLNLKTFSLSVIAILLILASGCTKQEMRIDKSKTDCPFDTTKLVDKDWYIFSPAAKASAHRLKWGSDGYLYGASSVPCGPFVWEGCSTFRYLQLHDSSEGRYEIVVLGDNYLKFRVVESANGEEPAGTIYELDRTPH